MLESKIEITSTEKPDNWEININNVNVHYLPELLGNVIADAYGDIKFNPATEKQVHDMKVSAINKFIDKLGLNVSDLISNNWIDINSRKPNHSGPFICVERQHPDRIYTNMYWDNDAQMFGTREGNGYAFITHWIEVPKFE